MHLGAKIKDLKMAKEMWDIVKADATKKHALLTRHRGPTCQHEAK